MPFVAPLLLLALAPAVLGQASSSASARSATRASSSVAGSSSATASSSAVAASSNSTQTSSRTESGGRNSESSSGTISVSPSPSPASNSSSTSSTSSIIPVTSAPPSSTSGPSPKRGIVYVSPDVPSDNTFWSNQSDMTWYYNYGTTPVTVFQGSNLEYVPMQWGLPNAYQTDMSFYNTVKRLKTQQTINYVLGFNEPDGCNNGGSCISAQQAAVAWVKQFEPMRKTLNITLGGPACTGAGSGFTWLQEFHTECANLHNNKTGCIMDFLPVHWYGNFEGLAAHLGQLNATYPNISSFWVTELGFPDQSLEETQAFYNSSTAYLDRLKNVGKYSWFGSFRSSVSNVGPNGAFLTQNGQLTDIGSWYLGRSATNNIPSTASGSDGSGTSSFVPGTYSGKPYSGASRLGGSSSTGDSAWYLGSVVLAGTVVGWMLL